MDVSAAIEPIPWLAKNCTPPNEDQYAFVPARGSSSSTRLSFGFCQPSIMVTFCAAR